MKIIFIILFCSSSAMSLDCGEYDMYGSADIVGKSAVFIVNQGSLSELKFRLNDLQEIKLTPYMKRSSKIRAVINRKMNGYLGEFSEIKSVEYVVPDKAKTTKRHGATLITSGDCL